MQVPFFRHDLGAAELAAVAKVLEGPILTTGDTVREFEEKFAEYLGVRAAVAVSSCTGALHLSLASQGVGPGDEVITTPMTFIATATAIIQAGAKPVFVDVERDTGLMDVSRVEAAITSRTRAIMPVHLYGQMCDMRALRRVADRHNLLLVEDAAHCVEGERDGLRPGHLGDTACFSFYATKSITSGEGGAIVTNDEHLATKLRLMRIHGMTKSAAERERKGYSHWDMTEFGWKYNMDNIQAALLLPQLERIEENWSRRDAICRRYEAALGGLPDCSLPATHARVKHARHLFPVWLHDNRRDEVVSELHNRGVSVVVNYRAIHLLTYFRERFNFSPGAFPNAERIGDATLSLPLFPQMTPELADCVIEAMLTFTPSAVSS